MYFPASNLVRACALTIAAGLTPIALAVPDSINYQAYLTNTDGSAVNTTVSITFAAYNVAIGGVPLWSQTSSVPIDQGLFSVTLADPVNPFPAGLFDGPVYIGLFVAGEEMLPRRELTTAAYSFKAADADTLQGIQASTLDQSSEVATLQGDLATVDGRVSALEATGADITSVVAGAGLTGGGTSGDVVVNVATGGINASMLGANSVGSGAIIDGSVTAADIATNAVGASEILTGAVGTSEIATNAVNSVDIADGTILPADINSTASFTIGGLTNNGTSTLNGSLTVRSGADVIIRDNFNGFRWYDDAGTDQFGAILARNTEFSFFDANNSRYALRSDANGVGIGTTLTNTGYDVSMPSLSVSGQTAVGLERISVNYDLSSTGTCHGHGNLTCFYGSSSVTCPVGKRLVGGGASGGNARFGELGYSYPSSNTTWSCSSSYDLSGISRNCYALCARLE